MKRKIAWMLLTLSLIALLDGATFYAQHPKWTIMVYLAGGVDASPGARGSLFQMKEVGSTANLNLLAQFDTGSEGTPTKRYVLTRLENAQAIFKFVESIETSSLKQPFKRILSKPPTPDQVELLNNLNVRVHTENGSTETRQLGQVLDQVFIKKKAMDLFQKRLQNLRDRQKLAENPGKLKALLLECLLEEDKVCFDDDAKVCEKQTDTSNPKDLQEFMRFGIDKFPAQHNMLIFWGHGDGFSVDKDATPENFDPTNQLTMPELRTVIQDLKAPIDILGFNACSMGMLEVLNQLRDIVGISIASEGFTPKQSWPYARIFKKLNEDPGMKPSELATKIVEEYHNFYVGSEVQCLKDNLNPNDAINDCGIDLSACDISKVSRVIDPLTKLVNLLIPLKELKDNQKLIDARVKSPAYLDDFIDLSGFCQLLKKLYSDDPIQGKKIGEQCDKIIETISHPNCIDCIVIKNEHNSVVTSFRGVSVYFPKAGDVDGRFKPPLEIKDIHWKEFLDQYLELRKMSATIN